jgi:hypothetical protein
VLVPSFAIEIGGDHIAHGTHPSPGSRQRHDERLALGPPSPRRRRTRAAWRVWPRPGNALNGAAGDVARYNLERKPFVFNAFAWLAEAARG